ncbi:hypothetical protein HMPREF0860_1617 [Treponema socranskii subsp. socranskii VPI DR56BR1116 = ATCC 35536]|uniref:Leucine rich repeat protein n=3 Tax=Treponema socranskii TaxID=53419 RepID=A0ABP2YPM2_TRESO|nr:hypothetical protein HMPREF0860_1617 [Treponema socranskii subsp. socranskii VPI DR56BR1116 = ATCC 35536]
MRAAMYGFFGTEDKKMNTRNALCIAALAFILSTLSCVPPSDSSVSHITITVRGGEHVRIIKNSFTVPAGLTWAGILAYADGCVNYDDSWEFSLWRIGNETGPELNGYYQDISVDEDTTVYVQAQEAAQEIEDGISLILHSDVLADPDKPRGIKIKVITADKSPIKVEGFKWKKQLTAEEAAAEELYLYPERTKVTLRAKNITEFYVGRWNIEWQCGDYYPNHITGINVRGCPSLKKLDCSCNLLTSLDVQGLKDLEELHCQENNLTSLDVQGLSKLRVLGCTRNRIRALDVQGLRSLKQLDCNGNRIKALNVRGLPLELLYCASNGIDSLDVQGLPLKKFYCPGNDLTVLDAQGLRSLDYLACDGNELTQLNVQGCTSLQQLICRDNRLTSLNVQGLRALKYMDCKRNPLTSLNVRDLGVLKTLDCSESRLAFLNVENCAALEELHCEDNRLASLDASGLSSLKKLHCYSNFLNADAFIKIFTALPERTAADNGECELFTERPGVTEGNCRNFTSPQALKDAFVAAKDKKHWKMYKYNKNGNQDSAG